MTKNSLENEPFTFRKYKNGNISILWNEKKIKILTGKTAQKFSLQISEITKQEAQLLMAKITGNFKRGNEGEAKTKSRR